MFPKLSRSSLDWSCSSAGQGCRGGFGQAQSSRGRSPPSLGLYPCAADHLLLHTDEPAHSLALTPRLPTAPPKAPAEPLRLEGLHRRGGGLAREPTCPQRLRRRVVGHALVELLSEVPLCCAAGAAGIPLSRPPARWDLFYSTSVAAKGKDRRSIPRQEACPCFELLWGKERKCSRP